MEVVKGKKKPTKWPTPPHTEPDANFRPIEEEEGKWAPRLDGGGHI